MVNVNPYGASGGGWGGAPAPAPGRRMRPGCLLLTPVRWFLNLVILVGIGVMLVTAPWDGLWRMVRGSADSVLSVAPGEIGEADLEAGEWILYAEGEVTVDDCGDDICRGDFTTPEVLVADEAGELLVLSDSNLSVSDAGTESVSLWSFDVEEAGPVTIAVGEETDIDRIAVARSPELELDSFRGPLIGLGIVVVGSVLRGFVGMVGSFFGG